MTPDRLTDLFAHQFLSFSPIFLFSYSSRAVDYDDMHCGKLMGEQ